MKAVNQVDQGCLAESFARAWTTAMLSDLTSTVWPSHSCPHITAAITMGTISFTAMFTSDHDSDYNPELDTAPQPHEPDASE